MEEFTIKEVLENKLRELKKDFFEDQIFQKVSILFDIWTKQKELGYLFDLYETIESNKVINLGKVVKYDPTLSYKDQYICFLMEHNLIWIDECEDNRSVLNMIYYWLLADIKKDKQILNKI